MTETQGSEWELPFPNVTGKGIKIAVIDSGVNSKHPHISAESTTGVVLPSDDGNGDWEDQVGHGTAVTAAIQEKAPGARYYAVKLFGPSLRSTANRLTEAIEWAIENGMNLINLSLGTPNQDYEARLRELVQRGTNVGCVIVSARAAGHAPMLPGSLDNVVGVDVDWDLPRNQYRIAEEQGKTVFWCAGYPRSLPGVTPARNLHGVSFAVANMTGFVARGMEASQARSLAEIYKVLRAESGHFHRPSR